MVFTDGILLRSAFRRGAATGVLAFALLVWGGPAWSDREPPEAASGPSGELMIAEFRGDLEPTGLRDYYLRFASPVLANAHGGGEQVPISTERGHWGLGGGSGVLLSSFLSVLDRRYSDILAGDAAFRVSREVVVGPELSQSDLGSTYLYLRQRQTLIPDPLVGDRYLAADDASAAGAGIARMWRYGEGNGRLVLGYEFAQESADEFGDRVEEHRINLSGRIPIVGGLDALLDAGYSRNLYSDPGAGFDLNSDRLEFRAGLAATIRDRLFGSLHFTYADEEFADEFYSTSSHSWGLNFGYRY